MMLRYLLDCSPGSLLLFWLATHATTIGRDGDRSVKLLRGERVLVAFWEFLLCYLGTNLRMMIHKDRRSHCI